MTMTAKPLTGKKVLAIALAAFGVIIAANLTLAVAAVGTFPGLEVRNSYVASQTFDAERAAQQALGWQVRASYDDGVLDLSVATADGQPAEIRTLDASIGRATHANADVRLSFTGAEGPYSLPLQLDSGKWELRLYAIAADGTAFHQRLPIIVSR